MNDKLFKLLNQLNAVRVLLECDGAEMSVNYANTEKCKTIQKEVDLLSAKEVKILDDLRDEILHKDTGKEPKEKEKKPKIAKKEVVVRSNGRKK